jgi:predicted adenine nucleotide alpha hydrolase (AANH) superfamily ATPase
MRKLTLARLQRPNLTINSWSAICRGAVLKGMSDETVVNHIAKYHYGIHFQEKYDSRKHEEQDKVWDMVECEWKAYHQMRWYISRVSITGQASLGYL